MTDAEIDKMCYPEAADLIGELHGKIAFLKEVLAEVSRRGKLTEEEREALGWAVSAASDVEHPAEDTLLALLERLTDRAPGT